jgi:micrococcal nuclease
VLLPSFSLARAFTALACLLLAAGGVRADDFRAVVTHVTEGDTIWVRPQPGGEPVQLRLQGLDAPDNCQLFGPQAKNALRERVLGATVRVRTQGLDAYGRPFARVQHGREDVGAWLVGNGFAWTMAVDGHASPYRRLEADARKDRRGLWALPGVLDARTFRERFRHCRPGSNSLRSR